LEAEVEVMKSLKHRNIVRYIGTDRGPRYLHIFLEYASGGSIASMLQCFGTFGEDLIRRYMFQVLEGLEYLHRNDIVHCDVKGANVLVTEQGIAKLADFGCSKILHGICTLSMEEISPRIRGSVLWMAPEVINQNGHGRSADIWSAGAMMIEMGTAMRPWPQFTNIVSAMFHIGTCREPPPSPEGLSSTAEHFLACCMKIKPSERMMARELLKHPFLQGAGEEIKATADTKRCSGKHFFA